MATGKKKSGKSGFEEPEITKARIKVLSRKMSDKMKELEVPEDIEAIIAKFRESKDKLRHLRHEMKVAWKRIISRCDHREGPPPKLPEGWLYEEGGPHCRFCGVELQPATNTEVTDAIEESSVVPPPAAAVENNSGIQQSDLVQDDFNGGLPGAEVDK